MADTKITALTAITTVDPAVDVLPIVDISDTTMAASGTTKKITSNQILGSGGTATLASATITGDLTVATTALKVVSASNRVLINMGSAIQGDSLEISAKSDGGAISLFGRASDNGAILSFRANGAATQKAAIVGSDIGLSIRTGTVERYNIDTTGVSTWSVGGSTAMTLNSTGLNVANGNVILGTSGKGIDFSANNPDPAGMTSELLSDYEEGTFTPTIQGSTTTGVGTYTGQSGKYTKVGNLVTFQVFLDWSAHTGTGNMRIGNLPFANGNNFWAGSLGYLNVIALTAGNIMTAYVEASQSYVTLQQTPTGGGTSSGVPIDTAGTMIFSASYTV
jgi:hypothetical protein